VHATHDATWRATRDVVTFRATRAQLDELVATTLDTLQELERTADAGAHERTRARLVEAYSRRQDGLDAVELQLAAS
jgi:hypothetical protein